MSPYALGKRNHTVSVWPTLGLLLLHQTPWPSHGKQDIRNKDSFQFVGKQSLLSCLRHPQNSQGRSLAAKPLLISLSAFISY